jgi:hypothetical protein
VIERARVDIGEVRFNPRTFGHGSMTDHLETP